MTKTFRFNNLEGTVKYIGPAKGKDGSWIGVELVVSNHIYLIYTIKVPKGDMDGTIGGEFLFECQPNHGVLLRTT